MLDIIFEPSRGGMGTRLNTASTILTATITWHMTPAPLASKSFGMR